MSRIALAPVHPWLALGCLALVLGVPVGCGTESTASDGPGLDGAAVDVALPDVPAADGLPDPGPDAGPDTVPDTVPDTAPDMAPDSTTDLWQDTVQDADGGGDGDSDEDVTEDAGGDGTWDAGPDVALPNTISSVCESDEDCAVECAGQGTCEEGACQFGPFLSCLIAVDDGKFLTCYDLTQTHPESDCLFCNPIWNSYDWTGTVIRESFEGGTGAFAETIDFILPPSASWTDSKERAASGLSSLYFGDPKTQSYDVGHASWARTFSVPLPVPDGQEFQFHFQLWLETEQMPGYDILSIFLIHGNGQETLLWDSDAIGGTTGGVFLPIHITVPDLPAQVVRLGIEFNTIDSIDNDYEGVYLDDLAFTTGCCDDQADCDDGNPCTTDSCPGFGEACQNEAIEGCCVTDENCDDGDPCTVNGCPMAGGICLTLPVDDCCHEAIDCDDSDPCTEDSCPVDGGSCDHQPLCCTSSADCDDGDPCTVSTCDGGQCMHTFTCCLSDGECNDGEYCTLDQCDDGACVHVPAQLPGCCAPEAYMEDYEGGKPFGWAFDTAIGGVGWQVADVGQSQSGSSVLYYGNPATMNYDTGQANSGSVTTAPIFLPSDIELALTFQAYMDVESSTFNDKLTVEVLTDGMTAVVATKTNLTMKSWKKVSVDLSYLSGKSIQIRFSFDTVSMWTNNTLGILIDDLAIETTCEPKPCATSSTCTSQHGCLEGVCEDDACIYVNSCCQDESECDDGLVCTEDLCQASKCDFVAISNCCEDAGDCDDANACTLDFCSGFGGACSHEDIGGCCLTNVACDDNDVCTQNQCKDNVCVDTWICCVEDPDCDDLDDVCTDDTCVEAFCSFSPTGAPGCCEENPILWDFEVPIALETTETTPPCKWQIHDTNTFISPTNVLYYGDVGAQNFDCGQNAGTATTEAITLLSGVDYTLSFYLRMDSESSTSYDKLFIYLVTDKGDILIWDKTQLPSSDAWYLYSFDFSALAGETFQLKFDFNTVDGILNDKAGVFVDDIFVKSTCLPVSCTSDGDCDDGLPGTTGTCSSSGCEWSID